jgi:DNA-binding NtrC family response regulator
MPHATVLVVDDDSTTRLALTERFAIEGYRVLEANSIPSAIEALVEPVDLVLLDHRSSDDGGATLLRHVRQLDQGHAVILLTASASLATRVEAMKIGAYHFAISPFDMDAIIGLADTALESTRLRQQLQQSTSQAARRNTLQRIVGGSAVIARLRHSIATAAYSPNSTVLLAGEAGTGKALAARIIHYSSSRANRPFMRVSCTALAAAASESELWGQLHSAPGKARPRVVGLPEVAGGGTMFLDAVGDMPPTIRPTLQRLLNGTFPGRSGLGSCADTRVIIATSCKGSQDEVWRQFQSDVSDALNVIRIEPPPLQSHREDIPMLVEYFIDELNQELGTRIIGASRGACALLQEYGWPGNVRELRNVVERAMLLTSGDHLDKRDFETILTVPGERHLCELPASGVDLERLERKLLVQALKRSAGNQRRAGTLLGLSRDQIRYRIEKFAAISSTRWRERSHRAGDGSRPGGVRIVRRNQSSPTSLE